MHVYAPLFRAQYGQLTLRVLPPQYPTAPLVQRQLSCPATVSYHVDHAHRVTIPRADISIFPTPSRSTGRTYRTTDDLGHHHDLFIDGVEFAELRAGREVRKLTTRDARVGGSPHTHEVRVRCV